jgi:hypothetical protein
MEFTIEFYEGQSGRCPVREFLEELKEADPDDFAAVMAGLAKLKTGNITVLPFRSRSAMTFLNFVMLGS